MIAWLPTLYALGGTAILVGLVVSVLKVDEYWIPRYQVCQRCRYSWTACTKICRRCLARGSRAEVPDLKKPTHDWQGYMDTGPIPKVPR